MWYMPYVRVRRAVIIYTLLAVGISLVIIALRYWPGVVQTGPGEMQQMNGNIDVSMLLTGGAALVGGLATVLGLNLAAENDGHLELAWTKPVSREGYALGVFAVDLSAMAACIGVTAICGAVVADAVIGRQVLALGTLDGLEHALAFCGFPVCVYAWIAALSASLKRNRGTVAGLFWPLMAVVGLLEAVRIPAVHAVAVALNTLNPLVIYTLSSNRPESSIALLLSGWAIAAVLLTAALVQWRRLEI